MPPTQTAELQDMAEPAASPSSALPALPAPTELAVLLAEWHALGGHRAEPVRFALVEALARRAGAHEGAARHWLDARLDTLVADLRLRLAAGCCRRGRTRRRRMRRPTHQRQPPGRRLPRPHGANWAVWPMRWPGMRTSPTAQSRTG